MEGDLRLLPKRPYAVHKNAFPNRVRLMTNHYRISFKKTADIYQFSFESDPPIEDDSIQVLRELISSIKEKLIAHIGFICQKGKIIWGIQGLDKPLILTTKLKENNYDILIKQTRIYYESDIALLEGQALRKILHVYSVALKEKIVRMGLKETTRGRYFRLTPNEDEQFFMEKVGLKVLRTYELRLVPLMKGVSLQVDVGSRVSRTQNFLETLSRCRSLDEKRSFIGCRVQCNYGNRNSYKILNIDFTQTPLSEFSSEKIQEKLNYIKYYYQQYNIKIRDQKQPLLQVVIRVQHVIKDGKMEKKEIKGNLIPELVHLVGIPEELKTDQQLRRDLAAFTKMLPSTRCQLSQNITSEFNDEKGLMTIQNSIEAEGFILPNPSFVTSFERSSDNGSINIKQKLKDPMILKKGSWLLVQSFLSQDNKNDTYDSEDIIQGFKAAQSVYGINIEDPKFVRIYKDHIEEWKREIKINFKDNLIVVLFFTNRESRHYDQLKRFLTNDLKVLSQVVLRKTLRIKGVLSVMSKIICQMNAKLGKALWAIIPKHPFWKDKSIVYGGLSLSRGKKGHTLAFVGTYSRDLTKVYSNSKTNLPSRQEISQQVYEEMLVEWIKKYYELQKDFPSIIILYREGLSDEQAKMQGQKELQALFKVVERANKKKVGYNPQIIYVIVNKRVNSRFYMNGNKTERGSGKFRPLIENPSPGTIIFEPLSTQNAYDFHLAAQKVTQGTCTPTHYRIAYDASQIPQEAIAQFTYEQCYNYYNWFGAVRVPSCLQNADKLSRLVGEHIRQNLVNSELLKTPFFL